MKTDGLELQIDGGTHDLLRMVQGSVGGEPVRLGEKGHCRYCGTNDRRLFRSVAHAVPEAFGNKWVVSLDECDACNAIFSKYEDSLAKTVGPILTVGGTLGKKNAVRQTGRSESSAVIKHGRTSEGGRQLSMQVSGEFEDHIEFDPVAGTLSIKVPVAPERFIPRYAYKALVKMGLGMLPTDELQNFRNLIAWVKSPEDDVAMPPLIVGMSFGSVGNAPRLVSAALLKRKPTASQPPYMVFVVSVGSVCFQLDLKSDELDGAWPPIHSVGAGIRWTNLLGAPGAKPIRLDYGAPFHMDWSSPKLQLQPFETVVTTINPLTGNGSLSFAFRDGAILRAAPEG